MGAATVTLEAGGAGTHAQRAVPGLSPAGRFAPSDGYVRGGDAGRDTGGVGGDRADFFVSHAGADRAWAEWVAWQLTDAGYTVELDAWDWAVGRNFVLAMSDALARCDRVLALLSAAYFERSRYTTEEWTAALVHGPDGKPGPAGAGPGGGHAGRGDARGAAAADLL